MIKWLTCVYTNTSYATNGHNIFVFALYVMIWPAKQYKNPMSLILPCCALLKNFLKNFRKRILFIINLANIIQEICLIWFAYSMHKAMNKVNIKSIPSNSKLWLYRLRNENEQSIIFNLNKYCVLWNVHKFIK